MGDLYKHKYTWLKVFLITYICEVLLAFVLLGLFAGQKNLHADWGIYMMPLFIALIGLLIGFIINIFTRFRKAILCYIAGHLLTIIGVFMFMMWSRSNYVHQEDFKEHNANFFKPIEGILNDPTRHALEKVIYKMEETYPLGAYELNTTQTDYVLHDTTGNSGVICTIVFTLPEENNNRFISQYFVKADSFSAVYEKKDSTTMEYKKFRKEMLKLHEVVKESEH